jgi:RNA polymerase sigma-70 factor (ECF subfamily)
VYRPEYVLQRAALAVHGTPGQPGAAAPAPDEGSAREAREALAELCQQYWYPVYAFIRRRRNAGDASELTQKFILSLIERNSLARVDPGRGRFRSWLLGAVKHFLANQARYDAAASRNEADTVSFDELSAERRYASEPRSEVTPEHLYDRAFSLCVLEKAIGRLEQEMIARGHGQRFEVVKRLLPGLDLDDGAYAPMAASLGVSPNHFKKIVFDCRAQFRAYLNAEIAELVDVSDANFSATPQALTNAIAEERDALARALTLPA